jgi:hypothetical protein
MNWLMREDFPTPADPSMTTLYPVGPGLLVLDSLEEAKDAVALVLAEPGYELPPPGTAAPPPAVRCSVLHKKKYCHLLQMLCLRYLHFKRSYEYETCHLY